tara:strand:+ start:2519 stop:2917 length:399 start_codon:yes stop_codon:yes gene_type:complete
MAFKLGKSKGLQASGGNISSKFSFKKTDLGVPGVPVYKKKLDDNILGEANMDGSIYISDSVDENSEELARVMNHEMQHVTAMRIGSETYDDNAVYFNGEVWPRGEGYIMNPHTGEKLKEGDTSLPWEANKLD